MDSGGTIGTSNVGTATSTRRSSDLMDQDVTRLCQGRQSSSAGNLSGLDMSFHSLSSQNTTTAAAEGPSVAHMHANKERLESTRHKSAILFVDISGFTKLSRSLEVESLSKVSKRQLHCTRTMRELHFTSPHDATLFSLLIGYQLLLSKDCRNHPRIRWRCTQVCGRCPFGRMETKRSQQQQQQEGKSLPPSGLSGGCLCGETRRRMLRLCRQVSHSLANNYATQYPLRSWIWRCGWNSCGKPQSNGIRDPRRRPSANQSGNAADQFGRRSDCLSGSASSAGRICSF